MLLWKKEFLQQKTKGQINGITGLFFLLFLGILLATGLQVDAYRAASFYLEDALAASNLASALIDLEEFGISHAILIDNPEQAYEKFCNALKGNLQLDENWKGNNEMLISGAVTVENFTVYNVQENVVTVYSRNATGQLNIWQGILGTVKAPNEVLIESTSIYSEISFPVEGILGVTVQAHKGKLVDVVA